MKKVFLSLFLLLFSSTSCTVRVIGLCTFFLLSTELLFGKFLDKKCPNFKEFIFSTKTIVAMFVSEIGSMGLRKFFKPNLDNNSPNFKDTFFKMNLDRVLLMTATVVTSFALNK